ncbi:MAG: metal ABC transporter ATP-binding protein [Candidatus Eremiobacterota bacterium]
MDTGSLHVCGQCCTKLENCSVIAGHDRILENINIHVHCGEFTALIGPNGAGKTTLLKVILREIPFTGKLHFRDSIKERPDRPVIGYVPQKLDFDLTSPVTVLDLFTSSLKSRPMWLGYTASIIKKAKNMLSIVEAEHLIDKKIGHLSGGELQRVLLALALSPVPHLLLLDEPVSGMDLSGIEIFYRMLSKFRQKYDLSIIFITHDILGVAQFVDRIIFLNRTVICDGTPKEVFANEIFQKTFNISCMPENLPDRILKSKNKD